MAMFSTLYFRTVFVHIQRYHFLPLSPSLSNTADRQDGVHCLTWRIVGITNVYIFRQTKLRVFVNCFVRIEREKTVGKQRGKRGSKCTSEEGRDCTAAILFWLANKLNENSLEHLLARVVSTWIRWKGSEWRRERRDKAAEVKVELLAVSWLIEGCPTKMGN